MSVPPDLREDILACIPHLRAFAISLTGDTDKADDLVHEAIVRGLTKAHQFQPGTSVQAWLFTILRNHFMTQLRKRKREVEDPDGVMAGQVSIAPAQVGHLEMRELRAALSKLPAPQREALLLVTAEGFSYEEAAEICKTKVGTIKSRVNRARAHLAELLSMDSSDDVGVDPVVKAAIQDEARSGA